MGGEEFRVGFHVTSLSALAGIRRRGLEPRLGPRSKEMGEVEPRVYFFKDLAAVEDALMGWLGESFDEEAALAVLEVDLSGLAVESLAGQFEASVAELVGPARVVRAYDDSLALMPAKAAKKGKSPGR